MAVYIAALLPGQSREVFRAIREEPGWAAIVWTAAFALALTLVVLTVCALLLKHVSELRKSAVAMHFGLLETLAIGLASIPLLSVWLLNVDFSRTVNDITAAVVAAALGFLVWHRNLRSAIVSPFARLALPFGLGLGTGACLVAGVILTVSLVTVLAPVSLAQGIGPFGLLCLFFGILTISSSKMTVVYDRHGWPILSVLASAAFLFAYMGWSNNHEVRQLAGSPRLDAKPNLPPRGDRKEVAPVADTHDRKPGEAFARWLEKRSDLAHYAASGRPYPVYVVAAQGGGLYAGAHAASVLARLQDECPGFARHVFAISGVSGGSLGAAVFASLIDALPPGEGKGCERTPDTGRRLLPLVERYFRNDFLSPLLAYALFPDFLQRFLPRGVPQFDRARGLEAGFEAAWKDTLAQIVKPLPDTTAFSGSFRDLWSASASRPALLLNATSVHYGRRVVIAPFKLYDGKGFSDLSVDFLNEDVAVTLSTAVGVSARFPVITPPAWVKGYGRKQQIVDGGYFENFGIATAMHLIDAIARHGQSSLPPQQESIGSRDGPGDGACAPGNTISVTTPTAGRVTACFKLIIIYAPPPPTSFPEHGELTAPLFAAYNVLKGDDLAGLTHTQGVYCGGSRCGQGHLAANPHVYLRYLDFVDRPLGWSLSSFTLERIMRAPPPETKCAQDSGLPAALAENACLLKRIRGDLG
jgi:predicted acylesterase/phospholipase RssA